MLWTQHTVPVCIMHHYPRLKDKEEIERNGYNTGLIEVPNTIHTILSVRPEQF
jgi:hypothetical protein